MSKSACVVEYSDLGHWAYVVTPSGLRVGYAEASLLYKIWKFSPSSSELHETFGMVYDSKTISRLIKKELAKRTESTSNGRDRILVATGRGRNVIRYLYRHNLLKGIEKNESS